MARHAPHLGDADGDERASLLHPDAPLSAGALGGRPLLRADSGGAPGVARRAARRSTPGRGGGDITAAVPSAGPLPLSVAAARLSSCGSGLDLPIGGGCYFPSDHPIHLAGVTAPRPRRTSATAAAAMAATQPLQSAVPGSGGGGSSGGSAQGPHALSIATAPAGTAALTPRFSSLTPLRYRAALEAAAAFADHPQLPPPDANPCTPARMGCIVLLVALSLLGLQWATPANIHAVVGLMRQHPLTSVVVYGAVFVLAIVLMLPGMLFSVASGAAFGWILGAAVAFVATTIGMVVSFALGRYLLHDIVAAALLKRVPNFPEIDRRIAQEGWKLVLLLRLSPLMPYNLMNYALGATSIRLVAYAAPSAAAALLYSIIFAYLGSAADDLFAVLSGDAGGDVVSSWWFLLGVVMAVGSAYGIARVCNNLLSGSPTDTAAVTAAGSAEDVVACAGPNAVATETGAAGTEAAAAKPPSRRASRQGYTSLQQREDGAKAGNCAISGTGEVGLCTARPSARSGACGAAAAVAAHKGNSTGAVQLVEVVATGSGSMAV